MTNIDPVKAVALINSGATLIDIREADEHARENIANAHNVPLSLLSSTNFTSNAQAVIFHCKAGSRTLANAAMLRNAAGENTYILAGGIEAWKSAGFPTTLNGKHPIEVMRQVQIAAGSLTLLGAALGATVNPLFYILAGTVGCGLLLSGLTGSCAMAQDLRQMPWNRVVP
jgi:rhodanese-related sulfurtransferase